MWLEFRVFLRVCQEARLSRFVQRRNMLMIALKSHCVNVNVQSWLSDFTMGKGTSQWITLRMPCPRRFWTNLCFYGIWARERRSVKEMNFLNWKSQMWSNDLTLLFLGRKKEKGQKIHQCSINCYVELSLELAENRTYSRKRLLWHLYKPTSAPPQRREQVNVSFQGRIFKGSATAKG